MEAVQEIEKTYALQEFVAELRRLADTLEANDRFTIELDGKEVFVPEDAVASIAYEIDEGRAEIEFQLSWETGEADEDENEDDDAETAEPEAVA